jgi:predicted ribosomally synthesized peptide with nif11-like leader
MSETAVRSFIELLGMNRALRARVEAIPRDEHALEQVTAIAERYGYRFAPEELYAVLREPRELGDEELDTAAGGASGAASAGPVDRLLSLAYSEG